MNCNIQIGEQIAELHAPGLLWLPAYQLLCASDIHFEKGSFFRRFGTLLPPYDSRETLKRLSYALASFRPSIFISLGDSFHDAKAAERMPVEELASLNQQIAEVEQWIWVEGNHDPEIGADILGERLAEFSIGGIVFRHELKAGEPRFEISGHWHPKATVKAQGMRISAPCFVERERKLIMPAFGSYTGGLNVQSQAFLEQIPCENRKIYLVHKDKVYSHLLPC